VTVDYAMVTVARDRALAAMVEEARGLAPETRDEFLKQAADAIRCQYPEVFDPAVRESIAAALSDPAIAFWL